MGAEEWAGGAELQPGIRGSDCGRWWDRWSREVFSGPSSQCSQHNTCAPLESLCGKRMQKGWGSSQPAEQWLFQVSWWEGDSLAALVSFNMVKPVPQILLDPQKSFSFTGLVKSDAVQTPSASDQQPPPLSFSDSLWWAAQAPAGELWRPRPLLLMNPAGLDKLMTQGRSRVRKMQICVLPQNQSARTFWWICSNFPSLPVRGESNYATSWTQALTAHLNLLVESLNASDGRHVGAPATLYIRHGTF